MKKITILFALFAFVSVKAQWSADTDVNTLVASSISSDSQSIGTFDGQTFIVFWKSVAAPVNFELRVQLLDSAGNQQFGEDGMLISNTIPMSTSTVFWKLAVDKNNNLYVGVTGTGTGTPGYVFKINTEGTMLWGENGVNLGAGYLPTILPLDNGEVVVCYWPGSQKAKIQKFTSAGVAVWADPVEVISPAASSATVPADLYEISNQNFVLIFHKKNTYGVGSNLFAQRYDADGVAQWATATQLADKGTAYNAFYSGAKDGDVIYYGYSGNTGTRFDSYLQRINADGTLPWGINGVDFDTNATNYEKDTEIAFSPGSQYVWSMARYTTSAQDLYGEYVQKFDKETGARQFTDNAKEVFAIDNNYRTHNSDLYLINDAPFFLIKSGFDNGVNPTMLSTVLLNTDGDFVWENDFIPVATFSANKGRVTLNKPVNGQVVISFSEAKVANEPKMYAQNFSNALLAVNQVQSNSKQVIIYPNPSADFLNLSNPQTIKSVKVYDILGHLVFQGKNGVQSAIAVSHWSKGMYVVTVETVDAKQQNFKFIKN